MSSKSCVLWGWGKYDVFCLRVDLVQGDYRAFLSLKSFCKWESSLVNLDLVYINK